MPDWKRLIVGDAFALDSRDWNFYRDIFLFPTFLLFSIMAVSGLLAAKRDFIGIGKCGLLSLLVVALMRERLVIVGASLGFVSLQSGVSFLLKHSLVALAVSTLSGVACLLLFRSLKGYKPSYSMEKGGTIATLLVMMGGGVFWYIVLRVFVESR